MLPYDILGLGIFFLVYGALFFVSLLAAVVALVVWLARRNVGGARAGGAPGPVVRRFYFYSVAFASAVVFAQGVQGLLESLVEAIEPGEAALDSSWEPRVARGLAMLVVGGLVWAWHWVRAQQETKLEGLEGRDSNVRRFYLYALMFLAMITITTSGLSLFQWAVEGDAFPEQGFPALFVWGAVWFYHWRVAKGDSADVGPPRSIAQLYTYTTIAYSLGLLLTGAGVVLSGLLGEMYNAIVDAGSQGGPLLGGDGGLWSGQIRQGLALFLPGIVVWIGHWYCLARNDRTSLGRAALSFGGGLVGALTGIAAVAWLAWGIAWWFLAEPGTLDAATHFRFIPVFAVLLETGAALVIFHYADFVARAGVAGQRSVRSHRALRAILALIGLGGMVGGVPVFVAVIVGTVAETTRGALDDPNWWRTSVSMGLVSLVVGATLWAGAWFPWKRMTDREGAEAREAQGWNIYLYLTLGVLAMMALGAAANVFYLLVRDGLEGDLGLGWLRGGRWSLGVLVAVLLVAPYHWLVLREGKPPGGAVVSLIPEIESPPQA